MKVSFFVDNLAANAIVRATPLAKALQKEGYDVEVIGFLINGNDVFEPYRDHFEYKTIHVSGTLRGNIRNLAALATGNIIYSCKPLITSFLPALIASGFGLKKPLFLDVEDNEFWMPNDEEDTSFLGLLKFRARYFRCMHRNFLLHPFTKVCSATTVVSRNLQRRYGGTIVLHGPDENQFNPLRSDLNRDLCKVKLGLPLNCPLFLFAGIPHHHKGLHLIVEALKHNSLKNVHIVLAGPKDSPAFFSAANQLGDRAHLLGFLPNQTMPELLAAVDVIPVPQILNAFTECQIPAKLIEAMAMKKIVVASRVSDISEILGEGRSQCRGWIFTPGNIEEFIQCLVDALNNPIEATERGDAARKYFIDNASIGSIGKKLKSVIEGII